MSVADHWSEANDASSESPKQANAACAFNARVKSLSLNAVPTNHEPVVDPWAEYHPHVTLDMVKNEEGHTICVEAVEDWGEKLDSAPEDGLRVLAEDAEINDSMLAQMCRTASQSTSGARIMTLVLPNNELGNLGCLDQPNQIRSINVSGNLLRAVPALLGCTYLVDLDLSYCGDMELQRVDTPPFMHLGGTLLRLNLTAVGLSSLHHEKGAGSSLLGGLEKVLELLLSENELEDLEDAVAGWYLLILLGVKPRNFQRSSTHVLTLTVFHV